jgi:catalase
VLDRCVDNFFAETEQVAFCTQNIIRGIDFTNDPLLQGRNFSYLDTQLKRLGGPNFTQLPVNAPKCPIAHFQQDGHMAMTNPTSRANYEPNSWPRDIGGPREDPTHGFTSYPDQETGAVRRLRPESFADHYSQAHQFFISQTPVEQQHIIDAFVFELSKCERVEIRQRMVAGLRRVDESLAQSVGEGLGLKELPEPVDAARQPIDDLLPSPALSILRNGPESFAGRKLGVLVTDGADADLIGALQTTCDKLDVNLEFIAPAVGGVALSDGSWLPAQQKIDGGPSVLYDAVVVVCTDEGAAELSKLPTARDFVTDAFAHKKFMAHTQAASALFQAAGLDGKGDGGFVALSNPQDSEGFIRKCAALRHWDRAE